MISTSSFTSAPTSKSLDFNILIMNEDSSELKSTERVYQRAIEKVKLEDMVSDSVDVKISTANNVNKAHRIIQTTYADNPDCFQIAHLPEIISGRKGEEFVDQIRREFESKNFGAIMTVSDETQINETESRNYGVYGRVRKPLTVETITSPLHSVIDMVLLKSKPPKKEISDLFIFRPIIEEAELVEYYKKRFEVWSKLNYIPPEFKSEKTGLEIDDYDKFSIPLGGFSVNGYEKLSIIARIITTRLQEEYAKKTRRIIRNHGDRILSSAFERIPESPLPIVESCKRKDKETELESFLASYGGLDKSVEYSRLMITDKGLRGGGLSTRMAQFHNMYARYILGSNVGLAECLLSHVQHNTTTNGFTGEIPSLGTIDAVRVEQVAKAIFVDLINNQKDKQLQNIRSMFLKYGFFCSCDRNDCIDKGYILEKSTECRRKVIGYEC